MHKLLLGSEDSVACVAETRYYVRVLVDDLVSATSLAYVRYCQDITDDQRKAEDELQKITDAQIKDVDKIAGEKEKEIMSV